MDNISITSSSKC